jgi:hypothetical protein
MSAGKQNPWIEIQQSIDFFDTSPSPEMLSLFFGFYTTA